MSQFYSDLEEVSHQVFVIISLNTYRPIYFINTEHFSEQENITVGKSSTGGKLATVVRHRAL